MCSPTPAGCAVPRIAVLCMLRSAAKTTSAPSDKGISGLNHTPHAITVYASRPPLPTVSRNTRFQAVRYTLPELDFHQPIAPASWRTFAHPTSTAIGNGDAPPSNNRCRSANSCSLSLRDGLHSHRQRRRDPIPHVPEDALPAFAISAGIIEPAFGGPALREVTAATRVQKFAFLAGIAQHRRCLIGLAPDLVLMHVLDGIATDMGFRRGRTVARNPEHVQRLECAAAARSDRTGRR